MSKFEMDADLIVSDYRQAANKQKQIEILANLNLCSPREIAALLRDHGEELPARWVKALEKPAKDSEENRRLRELLALGEHDVTMKVVLLLVVVDGHQAIHPIL